MHSKFVDGKYPVADIEWDRMGVTSRKIRGLMVSMLQLEPNDSSGRTQNDSSGVLAKYFDKYKR